MLFSDAYETAKMVCEQYYQAAPELKTEEFNGTFSLFSHKTQYIMFVSVLIHF